MRTATKARAASKGKARSKKSKDTIPEVLGSLSHEEAYDILQTLARSDKTIAERVVELVNAKLEHTDEESVAGDVQMALESLVVEDVWDNAGPSSRHGYVSPDEIAWKMFDDAVEPYTNQLKRLQEAGKNEHAMRQCMGILHGLYLFKKESRSEYKDWATDAPVDYFHRVLDDWAAGKSKAAVQSIIEFIKTECPDWYSPKLEQSGVKKGRRR